MSDPSIKPERAADSVARHLETLILEGSLRPGEALLPERDLALALEVSRPTLREALKMLADRGLLEPVRGRGIRVASLGREAIADPLMALLEARPDVADDYLEFRGIVESQAAAMAAERANRVDLDLIRACLDRIDAAHAGGDPDDEAAADAALHQNICEASHNLVLLQIMRALSGNLRSDVTKNRARLFALPAIRDLLRDQHRAIAQAILDRDPARARSAAQTHLDYVREAVLGIEAAEARLDLSLRRSRSGGLGRRPGGA